MNVNRNVLYLIVGVLAIAIGVLSYQLYQAKKQPEGFQINVGPDGVKYSLENSTNTGDDGWKQMLAPSS